MKLLLTIPILLSTACFHSPPRIVSGTIGHTNGIVCVGARDPVPKFDEVPDVRLIAIYKYIGNAASLQWSKEYFEAPPQPKLNSRTCLPSPADVDSNFPVFRIGERYSITALVDTKYRGEDWSFSYEGNFCMVERDGKLVPHQVQWDDRAKALRWDACHAPD